MTHTALLPDEKAGQIQKIVGEPKKRRNNMAQEYWKTKLTAFDAELCKMVESLTERPCEPKNGGDHYFIECNYREHDDPEFILAMWDAIEGRAGKRLLELKDVPERKCLLARISFYTEPCKDAAFIPKIETE